MDSATGDTWRLTHGRHNHNHFGVSPDGRCIAVNRILDDTNGNGRLDVGDRKTLFVLDLEAGTETVVDTAGLDAGMGGIDWSLDGEWIYLAMAPYGQRTPDVYRLRPDGRDLQNLTQDLHLRLGPPEATQAFCSDCGVSHDGEWIVFLYHPNIGRPVKPRVAVARVDGTDGWIVTDGGPLPPGRRGAWPVGDFDPELSTDGAHVVFSRFTDVAMNGNLSSAEIWRCRTDGSDPRRLTEEGDPASYGIPDWSADGRITAMTVDAARSYVGPLVMNDDGTDARRYPQVRGTHFRWIPGKVSSM